MVIINHNKKTAIES